MSSIQDESKELSWAFYILKQALKDTKLYKFLIYVLNKLNNIVEKKNERC